MDLTTIAIIVILITVVIYEIICYIKKYLYMV